MTQSRPGMDIKLYLQTRIDQMQSELKHTSRDSYNGGWLEGSIYNLKEMLRGIEAGEINGPSC